MEGNVTIVGEEQVAGRCQWWVMVQGYHAKS